MKITFHRRGYAHNSSSDHSLIYVAEDNLPIQTDEYSSFGWGFFTVADRDTKLNYLLLNIAPSSGYEKFVSFLKENEIVNYYSKPRSDSTIINFLKTGEIDHNSMLSFPLYRDTRRGINVEFLKFFIEEMLKDNYIILGGNDNSNGPSDHELWSRKEEMNDFIKLFYTLKNSYNRLLCEYDNQTKEFILSLGNGDILRVSK